MRGLLWGSLTLALVANAKGDSENNALNDAPPPRRQNMPVYMPHGVHLPTGAYPKRRYGARYPQRRAGRPINFGAHKENKTLTDPSPSLKPQPSNPHVFRIPTAPYPKGWRGPAARYPPRRPGQVSLPEPPKNFDLYEGLAPSLGVKEFQYPPDLAPKVEQFRSNKPALRAVVPIGPQFRPRQQYAAPMDPGFGPAGPTPLGPYSLRRPLRPLQPRRPQPESVPQGPLRDLDPKEKGRADRLNEPVPWEPDDTWQAAQDRNRIVRPPSPDELRGLVPPHMRVKVSTPSGDEPPDPEEVGYVDAPEPEHSQENIHAEPEQNPQYADEDILRMAETKRSERTTRAVIWRPSTLRLPELMGYDDAPVIGQEPLAGEAILSDEDVVPSREPQRRSGQSRNIQDLANALLL